MLNKRLGIMKRVASRNAQGGMPWCLCVAALRSHLPEGAAAISTCLWGTSVCIARRERNTNSKHFAMLAITSKRSPARARVTPSERQAHVYRVSNTNNVTVPLSA